MRALRRASTSQNAANWLVDPSWLRAAFLLREAHGLSYDEVARALDTDVGVVKSRLFRARAALREALQEDDDG